MNVDDVMLNFSTGTQNILIIVLALIMFGIALDTQLKDFAVVAKKPKPFLMAIAAQLLVLPAVTFGLTLILPVTPSMALGMILLACCPPGNVSQLITHRAGGNTALSVSMTAVANVLYIFALPLTVAFWGGLHPQARELVAAIELNHWDMLGEILLIIGIPFVLGIVIRAKFPAIAIRSQKFFKIFSLLALFGFMVGALAGNFNYFIAFVGIVMLVVIVHDAVALGIGYSTAVLGGLGTRERKAMTFEVGIRNGGLGLMLVFSFFGGLGGMAIVAGWWSLLDNMIGLLVATLWALHTKRITGSTTGDSAALSPGFLARFAGGNTRDIASSARRFRFRKTGLAAARETPAANGVAVVSTISTLGTPATRETGYWSGTTRSSERELVGADR